MTYKTKVEFMRKHNVVVFRMHDHMHVQRPDFTFTGSARSLGLDSRYETHRSRTASRSPRRLWARSQRSFRSASAREALRVVGDPNAKVSRIQLGVG